MSEINDKDLWEIDTGIEEFTLEKARNPKAAALRLLRHLYRQKAKFYVILLSVIISTGVTVCAPLVVGQAIDLLYQGFKAGTPFSAYAGDIGKKLIILAVLYLANSAFTYMAQYHMAGISQTLTLSLRNAITLKFSRLPLKHYDANRKGDLLSRATNDLERIADSLQEGMLQFITSAVTVAAAVIIMLVISPLLTFIMIATLLISLLATGRLASKIEQRFADNQQALGKLNGMIEEAFSGHSLIKALNREEASLAAFREINNRLMHTNSKSQFLVHAVSPLIRVIGKLGYIAVAALGGIFVVNGTASLGRIQAFVQYVDMCLEPTTEASYVWSMMQSAVASAERVFELLDAPEEKSDSSNKVLVKPKGKVEFEHVSFGYHAEALLIQDLSLSVTAGDTIAIVGPTGAGKTTLINLLMRFYEIETGRITIDGMNICQLNRGHLRKIFGLVLQDTWLFQGTIRDNIAYGRPGASLEEISAAAKAAYAHHFIQTLPQGYETILEEDGANLSQGQRQLLTISRAILAEPVILILDEATSSVDTRTEAEIQKALKRLMEGRTSFVIAHRLSTIRDADRILVMKDGAIIEQGNHTGLMSQQGFYKELYNSQFACQS